MPELTKNGPGISVVVLAAGESRRMGQQNKLLIPFGGDAVLRRTLQTLSACDLKEIVVVLGFEADKIQPLLAGLKVRTVFNENFAEGQMTSVHAGLAALADDTDGVMVCLGDQPLLTPADIDTLIKAFQERTRGSIVVPTFQGRRGNPIILASAQRQQILQGDRNLGCKRLIERYPDLVETIEMHTDHVVIDLDTPEDLAALQNRAQVQPVANIN